MTISSAPEPGRWNRCHRSTRGRLCGAYWPARGRRLGRLRRSGRGNCDRQLHHPVRAACISGAAATPSSPPRYRGDCAVSGVWSALPGPQLPGLLRALTGRDGVAHVGWVLVGVGGHRFRPYGGDGRRQRRLTAAGEDRNIVDEAYAVTGTPGTSADSPWPAGIAATTTGPG
jgi:hypothetical protein